MAIRGSFKNLILRPNSILVLYFLAAVAVSIQLVSLGHAHVFEPGGFPHTAYNNYVIFKESFFNLINDRDLYILYPERQWDLYKYSPTFAMFMGTMAYLPDVAGLALWNMLNAGVLFFAIRSLPLVDRKKSFILLFVFVELLTSLQNAQSNGLMAGSIILACSYLQRGKPQWATLWLVLATFIKAYGAVGFCLFLFYPEKVRFVLYAAMWTVLFALLPLAVTGPEVLMEQYASWGRMMTEDQSLSYGFSVMGWLQTWFGLSNIKNAVTLAGIVLFFVPLLRFRLYGDRLFQLLFLAHILIWVIIFNHKAESPTYVIAVAGVAIWYFAQKPVLWRTIFLWILFVGTCLTATDLFPWSVRNELLVPYVVKAVPVIIAWAIVIYEILTLKKGDIPAEDELQSAPEPIFIHTNQEK